MITTLGRELVRAKLPDKYKGWADKELSKKNLVALTTKMALEDPDGYVDVLQDLNALAENIVSTYGRDAALSFKEAFPDKETQKLNAKLKELVSSVLNDRSLTADQKEQKILDIGYKYTGKVQEAVGADQAARHTALASQIASGSRGNPVQLMQLMFGSMMLKDALNRDIPFLHMDPFVSGTSPMSYWVSSSAGRKGMYDVQAATGQAGYLGKQVTNVTHDVTIEMEDCGTTDTGTPFKAADQQNIGRVLLRPFHKHPAGSVVTADMIAEADDDEEMILRTPMTCKCAHGVCAKCNGLAENGKFPGVGSYVALNSARSFVEKVTQAGISCLDEDTMVRMADGTAKRIKDIQLGDSVLGYTRHNGTAPCSVLRVYDNGIQPMVSIRLTNTEYPEYSNIIATRTHRLLKDTTCTDDMLTVGDIGEDDTVHLPQVPRLYMRDKLTADQLCDTVVSGGGIFYSVTDAGERHAYDIEVDNSDNLYVLACGVITHNSKHGSGVGGKKVIDPEGEDQPTGFPNIERMFMAPSNFPGGAVLSPVDGTVSSIRPAAQGGNYITVGTQTLYCAPERTFKVKVGDSVSAGDVLTNGVPNPDEVVEYKGTGQGRTYYMNKLGDIFARSGFGVDRSNLESFSRAMINKVRITDEEGYRSWLPGDIASYSEVAARYTPRDNAVKLKPDKALNQYLEVPVLNYTIGTRITPAVAQSLNKYGFNEITVSPDKPPFESTFMRPAAALQNDSNWLPRLAGERLYDSLFDSAQKGITDSYDSASYVDRIIAAPFK